MDTNKLDNLPESSDKEFWGGADVHTNITPQKMFDEQHSFRRVSGHEAYCDHCGWGFALDGGDKIKDGKLYDKEGKLVI
jgi:hypothetical protein